MTTANVFQVGSARVDITVFERNMAMMGWAIPSNVAHGVYMPLHVRAVAVRDGAGTGWVFANAELCIITEGLRVGVIDTLARDHAELGYTEHTVMLTSQHTHSGPSGFSHHIALNMSTPGYSKVVYEHLVKGFVAAIVEATKSAVPATAKLAEGRFALHEPVAFNRSLTAYNLNPDVEKLPLAHKAAGTDRTMTLLRFDDLDGQPIATVNWFASHCTSVHSENRRLHPDNKGEAAVQLEERLRAETGRDVVCLFAQEAAGDVTPNFRPAWRRQKTIGLSDDDYESARLHGEMQANKAYDLWKAAAATPAIEGPVDGRLQYGDIAWMDLPPEFADGKAGVQTGPACFGLAMMEGTDEGPGPFLRGRPVRKFSTKLVGRGVHMLGRVKHRRGTVPLVPPHLVNNLNQGPKFIFFPAGLGPKGRSFYFFNQQNPILPDAVDWFVASIRAVHKRGGINDGSWVEHIMPVQLLRLGPVVIAGMSGEATTVAGRRVRRQVLAALAALGIERVIVAPYANSYSGYCVTPEEYQQQNYEGGHTLFGPYTLGAYQALFARAAAALVKPVADRPQDFGPVPPRVPEDLLNRRAFPLGLR